MKRKHLIIINANKRFTAAMVFLFPLVLAFAVSCAMSANSIHELGVGDDAASAPLAHNEAEHLGFVTNSQVSFIPSPETGEVAVQIADVSTDGISLIVENTTNAELVYENVFELRKLVNDTWETVTPINAREGLRENEIWEGFYTTIPENTKSSEEISWQHEYGSLPIGDYVLEMNAFLLEYQDSDRFMSISTNHTIELRIRLLDDA